MREILRKKRGGAQDSRVDEDYEDGEIKIKIISRKIAITRSRQSQKEKAQGTQVA